MFLDHLPDPPKRAVTISPTASRRAACIKCVHCYGVDGQKPMHGWAAWECSYGAVRTPGTYNPVTGMEVGARVEHRLCAEFNSDGECPDYEPKQAPAQTSPPVNSQPVRRLGAAALWITLLVAAFTVILWMLALTP